MVLVLLTMSVALCAASALLAASCFTSSATTAKPFPAAPARAASTEALMARRLVWKAMSPISLAILVICWALPLMSSMAEDRADICSLALWMRRAISSVWERVWPLLSVTSARRSFTWVTSWTKSSVDWFWSIEA